MTQEIARSIAADVTVISIALLAVTFILISLAFKGFNEHFRSLPSSERKELVKRNFISVIPILIVIGIFNYLAIQYPQNFQEFFLLALMGFSIIIFLYLIISGIRSLILRLIKRKRKSIVIEVDSVTSMYFLSTLILAISIFCTVSALFGIIDIALAININPNQVENFLYSRWLLLDGVIFFTAGIFATGYSYLDDKSREWKNKNKDS